MTNKITTEDHQIVVTELLPMSEAPRVCGGRVIAVPIENNEISIIESDGGKYWSLPRCTYIEDYITDDNFVGWLPMPKYKPEE